MATPMFVIILLELMITPMMLVLGVVDNSPTCFESCSAQVNCSISLSPSPFCGAGTKAKDNSGPDIAAEPVDLTFNKTNDDEYQYVHLSWRPPEDGSYNYLKGFLVQVTVINLDITHNGISGPICYNVQPASNWFDTHRSLHRQGGVVFFMNCLRIPATAYVELVISIHSLPLKPEAPKLAIKEYHIGPAVAFQNWNPKFKKWADSQNRMHLLIQNPLLKAKYYEIQIKSVEQNKKVFHHTFTASPNNKTQDELIIHDESGLPHFLIPGLRKEDNYSILMDVFDENKTGLPHMRSIQTNPFSLNFSQVPLEIGPSTSHGLDNSLIIIVSIAVVLAVAVMVCLVWKGIIQPSKLLRLVRNCSVKMNGVNERHTPSFLPIYCNESDNYVAAVEHHVSLLRHYLGHHSIQNHSQRGISFCGSHMWRQSTGAMENKECSIIIYLSPRLGEILKFRQTSPAQCSTQDVRCHQHLRSLHDRLKRGHGSIPIVVTFDCFQQTELSVLHDLEAFLFSPQNGEEINLSTPLHLASFGAEGCKVENLETLIASLGQQNCTQAWQTSLQGWRECEEAKAIERYLFHFRNNETQNKDGVGMTREARGISGSHECVHFSNNSKRSYDELQPCAESFDNNQESFDNNQESFDNNQESFDPAENTEDLKFLPDAPLISNSSGYYSGPDSRISEKSVSDGVYANGYTQSSKLNYHNKEGSNYTSHYSSSQYNPTKSQGVSKQNYFVTPDSVQINKGRTNGHIMYDGVMNILSQNPVPLRSSPANSVESDSLLSGNEPNGYIWRRDQCTNDTSHNYEWGIWKNQHRQPKLKDVIPPSLCHSNFTSLDSVSEQINRVNDLSCWSESKLSK